MNKKITFILLVCCLLASCGKKGDPEYKDPEQKVSKQQTRKIKVIFLIIFISYILLSFF